MKPNTPSIYDVSRLSGVSTATVSRAYSSPERVREETRRRVYEAAEMLNYSPNAIARSMAIQRTNKIAYLICKQGATILDEFYAGICNGILRTVNRTDYQLLMSTEEDWRLSGATAQSKSIEGVILGGKAQMPFISEFRAQGIPVVLVNYFVPGLDLPSVVADEAGGVTQAMEHLISRGHERIAMLAGRINPYVLTERYNAFIAAMKAHGLPLRPNDVKMCELNVESATDAAMELLSLTPRPTAVFCANDVIAAGACKAARRLGLRLPDDLAVVGYDDASFCTMLDPELTSVHIDCRRMGELCVERLSELLEGKTDVREFTVVPTELIVRRSS